MGRRLRHGGGPGGVGGPGAPRRLPPAAVPRPRRRGGLHRDHPARAAAGLRGAGLPPRRRAVRRRWSAARVRTPLFGVEVPVYAHPLAEPAKGTGIAMVCTFGDLADVTWWRELRAGHPGGDRPRRAAAARAAGRGARRAVRRSWPGRASTPPGARSWSCSPTPVDLIGEPRPITHPVKFYERGDSPLEIVSTRQWYIRNGGRDAALRERAARPRARAALGAGAHATPLRALGGRAHRRLAGQPPALLRRADPGVVPARRARRARLRPPADAGRGRAAGRPVGRRAGRLRRAGSAAARAGSSATRT